MHLRRSLAPRTAAALCGAVLLFSGVSRAEDIFRFPGMGTRDLGRGGASVARADDGMAAQINPAGLAVQSTSVLVGSNLTFNSVCFERAGPGSATNAGDYPEVCSDVKPTPLPYLAGVLRLTDAFSLGLAIAPPMLNGRVSFPETVPVTNRFGVVQQVAAPQRYMLMDQDGILLNPTLAAAYQLARGFRVGVGFIAGFGNVKVRSSTMSLPNDCLSATDPALTCDGVLDDPTADVLAEVETSDPFIPGVVVGAHWSPTGQLDVGASVTAQEAYDGEGDIVGKAGYFTNNGVDPSPAEVVRSADLGENMVRFRLQNPMVARAGVRFHLPRRGGAPTFEERDVLSDDIFDLELDVVYTRTSAHKALVIRVPSRPPIVIAGGQVPSNADLPLRTASDAVGFRLGGDFVVVPEVLAARVGAWYEPNVQDEAYLTVAQLQSQRIGLALGGQVRLGPVDVEVGYSHVMFDDVDNGGAGAMRTISGKLSAYPEAYRSPYPINGGRATQSVDIVSLGVSMAF